MNQIVVNADPETHAWVKELSKLEKRTMGNQVLALLGIARSATQRKTRKPRAKKGASK